MSALRQAATGPPQVASQIWTDHFSRFWESIMHAMTETAPVDAGATQFKPRPTDVHRAILTLDLGTTTGWAVRGADGHITSGTVSFRPSRYDGGGMRYLRFRAWLDSIVADAGGLTAIYFEEVRRHVGTDAAHLYGGFLATLTAWCEQQAISYQGVPVGTVKRHIAAKGNADKAAVMTAVRARGFSPTDDNEADAIAILLWAIETEGGVR